MKCMKCDSEIKESDKFCNNCGEPIEFNEGKIEKKHKGGLKLLVIIFTMLTILLLMIHIVSRRGYSGNEDYDRIHESESFAYIKEYHGFTDAGDFNPYNFDTVWKNYNTRYVLVGDSKKYYVYDTEKMVKVDEYGTYNDDFQNQYVYDGYYVKNKKLMKDGKVILDEITSKPQLVRDGNSNYVLISASKSNNSVINVPVRVPDTNYGFLKEHNGSNYLYNLKTGEIIYQSENECFSLAYNRAQRKYYLDSNRIYNGDINRIKEFTSKIDFELYSISYDTKPCICDSSPILLSSKYLVIKEGREHSNADYNDGYLEGLADYQGNILITPQYEDIRIMGDYEYFPAMKDGKWGIIDKDNNTLVDFNNYLTEVYDNILIGYTETKLNVYNASGQLLYSYDISKAEEYEIGIPYRDSCGTNGPRAASVSDYNNNKYIAVYINNNYPDFSTDDATTKKYISKQDYREYSSEAELPKNSDGIDNFSKYKYTIKVEDGRLFFFNQNGKEIKSFELGKSTVSKNYDYYIVNSNTIAYLNKAGKYNLIVIH